LECQTGQCVPIQQIDAGVPPLPDAGMITRTDGGDLIGVDAGVDSGMRRGPGPASPGCGCRAVGMPESSIAWLAPIAIALFIRRRRGR
jgi:MYXO-CTERM domain-containing protein